MIHRLRQLWTERRALVLGMVVLASGIVVGAVGYGRRNPSIPTLVVARGDFVDSLQFRGEVKAVKSTTITAPAEAGELRILKIVPDGTTVKQGDMIVEFDKTRTVQDLARYRSTLKTAQAEIEQARAKSRLTEEEDVAAVMKARYDVEAAKLDASKQEIVSKIEGAEAKLKLADAEQKLRELEQKLKSDRVASQATVQAKIGASQKAGYDVERAERAMTKLTLYAPLPAMISLVSPWRMGGEGAFKPGDQAWPGAPIAELPDASTLHISARVAETERGRLAPEQLVAIHVDAITDRQFDGKITKIGTIATSDFSGGWPFPRNFDLSVGLGALDPRLKPGMTAQLTVIVDRMRNVLTIPVQASFQKSGQTVAYTWEGSKFRERVIDVGRRSGDRILVAKGLQPGDRVALADPSGKE